MALTLSPTLQAGPPSPDSGASQEERQAFEVVSFPSGNLKIFGALWKPTGPGPFPAMIFNHGSEQRNPLVAGPTQGYGNVGKFYLKHGFVCLIPLRRGHSGGFQLKTLCTSEGVYFSNRLQRLAAPGTPRHQLNELWLQQQEVDNQDVEAAVGWLQQQPYVDRSRMVMSGISFGGIQTVLTAEKGLGIRAFIPFSPGAMSWNSIPELHDREKRALEQAQAPVFLLQAANDYSLGPSEFLGPVLDRKGPPNRHKLYPPFMPEYGHRSGHGGFAMWPAGSALWSQDVLDFLHQAWGDPTRD